MLPGGALAGLLGPDAHLGVAADDLVDSYGPGCWPPPGCSTGFAVVTTPTAARPGRLRPRPRRRGRLAGGCSTCCPTSRCRRWCRSSWRCATWSSSPTGRPRCRCWPAAAPRRRCEPRRVDGVRGALLHAWWLRTHRRARRPAAGRLRRRPPPTSRASTTWPRPGRRRWRCSAVAHAGRGARRPRRRAGPARPARRPGPHGPAATAAHGLRPARARPRGRGRPAGPGPGRRATVVRGGGRRAGGALPAAAGRRARWCWPPGDRAGGRPARPAAGRRAGAAARDRRPAGQLPGPRCPAPSWPPPGGRPGLDATVAVHERAHRRRHAGALVAGRRDRPHRRQPGRAGPGAGLAARRLVAAAGGGRGVRLPDRAAELAAEDAIGDETYWPQRGGPRAPGAWPCVAGRPPRRRRPEPREPGSGETPTNSRTARATARWSAPWAGW